MSSRLFLSARRRACTLILPTRPARSPLTSSGRPITTAAAGISAHPPLRHRPHLANPWPALAIRLVLDLSGSQGHPLLPPSRLLHRPRRPLYHPRLYHGGGTSIP